MKTILSALPLLLVAAAICVSTAALALGLRIISPDTLAIGIGAITCAGLCAMSSTHSSRRCC